MSNLRLLILFTSLARKSEAVNPAVLSPSTLMYSRRGVQMSVIFPYNLDFEKLGAKLHSSFPSCGIIDRTNVCLLLVKDRLKYQYSYGGREKYSLSTNKKIPIEKRQAQLKNYHLKLLLSSVKITVILTLVTARSTTEAAKNIIKFK